MEVKMGHTAIICKSCGTVTAVENEALETMREYKCPVCAMRMSDYGFAALKMHYYYLMYDMYQEHWGSVDRYQQFVYDIHLWPHFETKAKEECICEKEKTDAVGLPTDLISRKDLLEKAVELPGYFSKMVSSYDIVTAPAVEAKPVVHGYWEVVDPKKFPNETARIRCSACKKEPKKHTHHDQGHGYSFDVDSWDATDYCPNCGAKMDGDGNGDS